jgi:hypothetical protein
MMMQRVLETDSAVFTPWIDDERMQLAKQLLGRQDNADQYVREVVTRRGRKPFLCEFVEKGPKQAPSVLEQIKFFIAHGADVNALDEGGWPPLAYAVENEAEEIVQLLVQCGANVNAQGSYRGEYGDWEGNLALICARAHNCGGIDWYLRQHGATD